MICALQVCATLNIYEEKYCKISQYQMYRLSNIYISVADSQIFFYFPVVTKLHSCKKIEKKIKDYIKQ